MKFSTAPAVALIAAFAPSLVSAANLTVVVGANRDGTPALKFDPQQIIAQKGDVVNFEFRGGNHTITQSSFANPCAWQRNTVTNENGFNSGFLPYDNTTRQVSVYSLAVNDPSAPIWFFCGRPPHCKSGMFGAINAPTTGNKTFQQFTANVQSANEPGLGTTVPFTPPSASGSSSGSSAPTSSGGSPSSASPTTSGSAAPQQSKSAAGSVTAGPTVILGFAGLVAGLIL
jgi:plastocyanin